MEKGKVLTGARARLSINGVKVGYCRGVTIGEDWENFPIEVLDNIEVEEFVTVAYRVTFSASMFRIIKDSIKSKGWAPKGGVTKDERLKNILTSGEMQATIEDTSTNTIWGQVEQVKIASHNWTIDPKGVVGEDVTFNAIRVKDESEI